MKNLNPIEIHLVWGGCSHNYQPDCSYYPDARMLLRAITLAATVGGAYGFLQGWDTIDCSQKSFVDLTQCIPHKLSTGLFSSMIGAALSVGITATVLTS